MPRGKYQKSEKHKKKISETYKKNPSIHWRWNGGRIRDNCGYILMYSPNHPNKNKRNCVQKHRLIMERHLGRYLKKSEVVHHIDGNRENNNINNLKLFPNIKSHRIFHCKLNEGEK